MAKHGKPPQSGGSSADTKKQNKQAKRERKHSAWRVIGYLFGGLVSIMVFVAGAGVGYVTSFLKGLPTINAATFTNTSSPSIVYDRYGKVIGKFAKDGDRQPISNLNQVSPNVVNAFIAAEDKTFYQNIGINPLAMGRAFVQDLLYHRIESGASTITQQTVKLAVFPAQERTMKRKVQEIALALELNHILTKDEIMTDYMNWVYMGEMGTPVYGVKTASELMFHKSPKDLNLPEAAFLAAIPNNASYFSPYQYFNHTVQRQHYILNQMLLNHMISQSDYQAALAYDIKKDLHSDFLQASLPYPYILLDNVEPLVAADLVKAGLYDNTQQAIAALPSAGYKIYTSIDLKLQDATDKVLANDKLFGDTTIGNNLYEAGTTLIDNQTGGILAIGGGRHFSSKYNGDMLDHSSIPRQPGSSVKPLIDYGPAIDLHRLTAGSVLLDAPVQYGSGAAAYAPKNDENNWSGIVTVREALTQSINVPAIKVLNMISPELGTSYLAKVGITTSSQTLDGQPTLDVSDEHQLSSAIGGLRNGLTVQQMTSAYTVFPNQGVWRQSYLISKVQDQSGKVLFQFRPQVNQVFSPQTAYIITSILHDVVYNPTGTAYAGVGVHFPGYNISGKTGTTDSLKDGWFVGYTPKYTMGIWMGYDRHQTIAGANYNLKFQVWDAIMQSVLAQDPPTTPYQEPPGIVNVNICKKSGQLPTTLCKTDHDVYSELFISGTEPTQACTVHVQVPYVVLNGTKYLATTSTPPNEIKMGVFLKPPFQIPAKVNPPLLDGWEYVPPQPDPRGGTVLSGQSGQIATTLPAPQNVKVVAGLPGVQITWDSVPGATGYTLWRATNPAGPYTNIAGPMTVPGFVDTAVPSGATTLYYQVYAMSNSGMSVPSAPESVSVAPGGGGNFGGNTTGNSSGTTNTATGNNPANT